jgi:hypothetical protein
MALSNTVTIADKVADITVTQVTATTDTNENAWVAAQGTGVRIYLTALDWCDTSATTITIKSGSNTIAIYELAANSGMIGSLEVPLFTNTNEALNITTSSAGVMKITWTSDQRISYRLRVI